MWAFFTGKAFLAVASTVIVTALGGYVLYLHLSVANAKLEAAEYLREAEDWRAKAVTYAASNKALQESYDRFKADSERANRVVTNERDLARREAELNANLATEILNASPDQDAPAAIVLDQFVSRVLSNQQAARGPRPPTGSGDPVRETTGAGFTP